MILKQKENMTVRISHRIVTYAAASYKFYRAQINLNVNNPDRVNALHRAKLEMQNAVSELNDKDKNYLLRWIDPN